MEKDLLRKKDVVELVGVAKSTVSDWMTEFHMYIATAKQGSTVYYKTEAVEVLQTIKEMRDRGISKPEIAEKLAERFPINADDVANSVSKVVNNESDNRSDALITVMSTMGKVVEQIGRQDGQMREMHVALTELQNEVAAARENESKALDELKRMEERIKALEEEKSKGFFAKLFGR
jgi:DNA-binding transcriptional MerR regulator